MAARILETVALPLADTSYTPMLPRIAIPCFPLVLALACGTDSTEPPHAELVLSTEEHDFGEVTLGTSSAALRLVVVNRGRVRTGQLTVALAGPHAGDFWLARDLCSGTHLRSGGTCVVEVQLRPQSAGGKEAVVSVSGPDPAVSATVRGSGADVGLRFAGDVVAFGDNGTGTTRTLTIAVRNSGLLTTGALTTELAGGGANAFSITRDGCRGRTLAFAQTCDMDVLFTAGSPGLSEATLSVRGSPGGTVGVPLRGSSGTPTLLVGPANADFGLQRIQVEGEPRRLKFINQGQTPSGTLMTVRGGSHPAEFFILPDDCTGRNLQPGQSCDVWVSFGPSATGTRSATLTVSGSFGATSTVSLTGTGGSVVLSVTPASLDFGSRMAGLPAAVAAVELRNTGTMRSEAVTAEECFDWDCVPLSDPGTSCAPIDPGGSCMLSVQFAPPFVGFYSSEIFVSDGPSTARITVAGQSTGLEPSTRLITFPATATGVPSSSVAVVVTNTANQTTGPVATTVTSGFEVVSQDCGHAILVPGRTCTVVVRATAPVPGRVFGELRVVASPGGVAQTSLSVVVQ